MRLAMKTKGPFLAFVADGGEWSSSLPGRFTPRKVSLYPLDRRLGGTQSAVEKRKIT
jgi:hypothetical protein